MPDRSPFATSTFYENQAKTLSDAFEEALRLSDIEDRTSLRAESLAQRVILIFKAGETESREIARLAAGN